MKRVTLTDEQRALMTGLAVHAATWTITALLTALLSVWLVAAIVVGSVGIARWIGGQF